MDVCSNWHCNTNITENFTCPGLTFTTKLIKAVSTVDLTVSNRIQELEAENLRLKLGLGIGLGGGMLLAIAAAVGIYVYYSSR